MLVDRPDDSTRDVKAGENQQRGMAQGDDQRGTEQGPREKAHHQKRRHEQFPAGDLMSLQPHAEIRSKIG